ncbi:MAG: hypothetical protein ABFD98_08925, partial [Syntrophobacteraceae bacterium]
EIPDPETEKPNPSFPRSFQKSFPILRYGGSVKSTNSVLAFNDLFKPCQGGLRAMRAGVARDCGGFPLQVRVSARSDASREIPKIISLA